jgi:hypothetical protein
MKRSTVIKGKNKNQNQNQSQKSTTTTTKTTLNGAEPRMDFFKNKGFHPYHCRNRSHDLRFHFLVQPWPRTAAMHFMNVHFGCKNNNALFFFDKFIIQKLQAKIVLCDRAWGYFNVMAQKNDKNIYL